MSASPTAIPTATTSDGIPTGAAGAAVSAATVPGNPVISVTGTATGAGVAGVGVTTGWGGTTPGGGGRMEITGGRGGGGFTVTTGGSPAG